MAQYSLFQCPLAVQTLLWRPAASLPSSGRLLNVKPFEEPPLPPRLRTPETHHPPTPSQGTDLKCLIPGFSPGSSLSPARSIPSPLPLQPQRFPGRLNAPPIPGAPCALFCVGVTCACTTSCPAWPSVCSNVRRCTSRPARTTGIVVRVRLQRGPAGSTSDRAHARQWPWKDRGYPSHKGRGGGRWAVGRQRCALEPGGCADLRYPIVLASRPDGDETQQTCGAGPPPPGEIRGCGAVWCGEVR